MKDRGYRLSDHLCHVSFLCRTSAAPAACSTACARSYSRGVRPAAQHAGRGSAAEAAGPAHARGRACRAVAAAAAAAGAPPPYDEATSGGRLE